MFTHFPLRIAGSGLALLLFFAAVVQGETAQYPYHRHLGVNGVIIEVDSYGVPGPSYLPNVGFRIDRVYRHTPAARMGLEPGDVIVSIDSMRFTTLAGARHAMRCAGQHPSLLLVDVRTGGLIRRSVYFPHWEPAPELCEPRLPDTYLMSID